MNIIEHLWNRLTTVRRDRGLSIAFRRLLLDETGRPSMDAALVLGHLRVFCGADISTMRYDRQGKADALATAAAAGRQEVWQQFYFYLNVNEDELVEIDRVFQRDLRSRMQQPLDA